MLAKQVFSNMTSIFGIVDDLHTTLVAGFLDVTHSSASSQDLGLDNATIVELLSDLVSFILIESNLSNWNGNSVGVQESTSLVLVKFDSSNGSGSQG
jgi:hypothetical protein